jgi:WD40 repeat protein
MQKIGVGSFESLVKVGNSSAELIAIIEKIFLTWQRKLFDEEISQQIELYIPAMLGDAEKVKSKQRKNAEEEMYQFLLNDKRVVLLLGDSGSGKSLFGQWFVNSLWMNKTGWIPLFIHLPMQKIKKGFLEKHLSKECHLNYEQINLLKSTCKFLLILDAYDEMKEKYKGKNIYRLGELYNWNVKVIISCRTESLVVFNAIQQRDIFMSYESYSMPHSVAVDRYYVQFFDLDFQIPRYVQRWQQLNPQLVDTKIDYLHVLRSLPGLVEVIANPFVLWIVIFSLPALLKEYQDQTKLKCYHLTRLDLFDKFTKSWFERQRDKFIRNGLINDDCRDSIVSDFQSYCQQLANVMWQKKINSVRYVPSQDSKAQSDEERNLWDTFFSPTGNFNDDPKKPLYLIRQGALLRILNGQSYTFLHHSLLEYYSAKSIFEGVANKASIGLGLEINAQLIVNPAIIRAGADHVLRDTELERVLWEILEESKHDVRVETAAANAITILVAANKSFAGKDLRRLRIRGANIYGGNFEGAKIEEADLRGVNISQAWLTKASLSGSCVDELETSELFSEKLTSYAVFCTFAPDGRYYIVLTSKGLIIYDVITHKNTQDYILSPECKDQFTACAISPDSKIILVATKEGNLIQMGFPSLRSLNRHQEHTQDITALAISLDGTWFLSRSKGSVIKKWDMQLFECTAVWPVTEELRNNFVISPDGRWVYSDSFDVFKRIMRFDALTGRHVGGWGRACMLYGAMVLSSDGKVGYSTFNTDCAIHKVDAYTGSIIAEWNEGRHTNEIQALSLSLDGSVLLSGSRDRTIKRWDTFTGRCVATLSGHTAMISALTISPDLSYAISVGDNELKRWCLATNCSSVSGFANNGAITAIAVSSEGECVFLASVNGTIEKWSMLTGTCLSTMNGHIGKVYDMTISRNRSWLFSASNDKSIKHWDLKTGLCLSTWSGHSERVTSLAVSSNSEWVLSVSCDQTIKRWDIAEGRCVATWKVNLKVVSQLSAIFPMCAGMVLNHDDRWMIAGFHDNTTRRFDTKTGECLSVNQYSEVDSISSGPKPLLLEAESKYIYWSFFNKLMYQEVISCRNEKAWKLPKAGYAIEFSPDGRFVLLGDPISGKLTILELLSCMLQKDYNFPFGITKIKWCPHDHKLVIISMEDGSLSVWLFDSEDISLHLQWRSKSWGLVANDCDLLGVYGLPEQQQAVFKQKGAVVQLSAKSSEDTITPTGEKKTGVLTQRNQLQLFNSNNPPRSLFDKSMIIHREAWVVSIVRNKTGEGKLHAFMILEGVEDGYYYIRRIDFIIEQRHKIINCEPVTGARIGNIFGQALIEIADKSLFDCQSLVGQCCAISSAISPKQGLALLQNIRSDQKEKIGYCILGNGSQYRMFRMKEAVKHHNCLSWCQEHLEKIGIDHLVRRKWIDGIVSYTPWIIPDDHQDISVVGVNDKKADHKEFDSDHQIKSGEKCITM